MDDNEDLNEVLDITQRQKRAMILRAHKTKIERARELAKRRMAPEKNIKKRAYAQARQIVRKRFAGARGAEYEKLGPSEKIAIDRAIEKKQALIKKIALRLIPRVKQAEQQRLHSFMKGQSLTNTGAPEGHKPVSEELNSMFEQMIGDVQMSPKTDKEKKDAAQKKTKSPIIQYAKFGEESDNVSAVYQAIAKKAGKSGIDIDILGEVYDRGMDAWTEDMPVSQQQYAFARVNSFINKGKSYYSEDADLREMGGDQHYGDTRGATSGGAKGTPITKDKMKKDASKALNQLFQKSMKKEEVEIEEGRAPGTPSIKRYKRPDGTTALKSLNKWGKRKDWRDTEGGLAKAKEHAGVDTVTEEVMQTNENFIDGKGPGKPGDAARHGLKGKSASELKKVRSSETASPRKKQLAHWMLNMHHNECVDESLKDPEDNPCWKGYKPVGTKKKAGKTVPNCVPVNEEERPDPRVKVEGTNCRNCVYWRKDLEKPVTKEELNLNGGLKAPNKEYIAMSKRIDLGTLPGKDSGVKIKGFCDHDSVKDWVTERMCCSQWDSDGMIRDYKGQSPVMEADGESIVPQTTSRGSKLRKRIEKVDRAAPHTEHGKQQEIQKKIIDEEGNSQSDPKKRLVGTDSLVKAYKKDTPGQSLDESFNIAFASGVGVTLTAADLGMKTQGGFALHPSVIEEMERRAAEEVEEEVRSADVKGVVVRTAAGKTVVRKQKANRKIIGTGNLTDGKPDDTL